MGALSLKIPGFLASINSRMKEQSEEFRQSNGREPTNKEYAGMFLTNAGVLGAEKFLLIGPLKSIFKAASKTAAGKSVVRGAVVGTAGTIAGEMVQETADQLQEQYWAKGGSKDAKEWKHFKKHINSLKKER